MRYIVSFEEVVELKSKALIYLQMYITTLTTKGAKKKIIKRLLFGKPLVMSVYQDKYGNTYGGVIHKKDNKSYINVVRHIEEPTYLGELEIY